MRIINLRGQQLADLLAVVIEEFVQAYRVNPALGEIDVDFLFPKRLVVFEVERCECH